MKFVDNLSEAEYIEFFNKFPYSHFLQSYAWGETAKESRGKIPCYVGLKNEKDEVVAAALLLKKKLLFGLSYYYAPRGYLIDFKDKQLLKTFTEEIKKYLKKTKGIYLKINPEIMYQEIDKEGNRVPDGKNNIDIYNDLINLGYKHKGFVKLHENNEPRYTFRRYFKSYHSMEEIKSSISKTFMKTVRRSYNYNLNISINNDKHMNYFYELYKANSKKNKVIRYSEDFFINLYKNGKKYNNVLVFDVSVNGKDLYRQAKEDLDKLESDFAAGLITKKNKADNIEKLERLKKDLETFEPYKDKEDLVICSMINGIANKMMWTMYIGTGELGEYLFAVNRVYYESVEYCFNNDYKFIDLYGTVGDPHTKYKNLSGLHAYKERFGDTYIEFIGEFDLVNKPLFYLILPTLLKIYRKFKR